MQRKKTKQSRGINADEKRFLAWLKERRCCLTGEWGVEVHHCVGSSVKHNKVHIGHAFCIPLSVDKHREYHNGTKVFREKYGPQALLWLDEFIAFKEETNIDLGYDVEAAILDLNK